MTKRVRLKVVPGAPRRQHIEPRETRSVENASKNGTAALILGLLTGALLLVLLA